MTTPNPRPFCALPSEREIEGSLHGIVIRDPYPISPGHTLVIARRHVGSFFGLTADERLNLLTLLDSAKVVIDREFAPHADNIGVNHGTAAGPSWQRAARRCRRKAAIAGS